MPTPKQIEELAAPGGREALRTPSPGPADPMPAEYWQAVLNDPRADAGPQRSGSPIQTQRLSKIRLHLLRVGCSRCGRTIEIQKADALRMYGPDAVWKAIGQRLLDNTCPHRTGSHEDDGCWPSYGGS